ncbi:MAG: 4Fe-4S binding protein [Elusimicrobiota bacterium]|nr:4Fe-4S binding protein [Elusimicrobiota bacterium]
MPKIEIDEKTCKSCGLCIEACPKKCIAFSKEVNKLGLPWAEFVKPQDCIGCGFCYQMCPDVCIEVYK